MEAKEKLEERTKLFDNAFTFEHNDRTPQLANIFTWPIFDAGYDLNALYDYDILEKVNDEFSKRYQFDARADLITRNPVRATRPIGQYHVVSNSGETLEVKDHVVMEPEDYPDYVADPDKVYWTKIFKRRCNPGTTVGDLTESLQEFINFGAYAGKMLNKCHNEYGELSFYSSLFLVPIEKMLSNMRGIKGAAYDLRRVDKGLLKEFMDTVMARYIQPGIDATLDKGRQPGYISCISSGLLAHTILSPKQFEEIYWPYLGPTIEECVKRGRTMTIISEADMLRFAEFFEDVPKGVLMILIEQDDPFEFRKRLPNIAIAGGMPTTLLGHGTKEECIDYAKKLIDELGEGYVFSQNKMVTYRNDATRENLLAVTNFVREYRG